MRILYFSLLISMMLCFEIFGQDAEAHGQFSKRIVKYGEKVFYGLRVVSRYENQIMMPDSTANFQSFQLLDIKTFKTKLLNDSTQCDSVAYELVSFSLDSVLILSLPISEFYGKDSVLHYPKPDTLRLTQPLQNQTVQFDNTINILTYKFNYQLYILIILPILTLLYSLRKRIIDSVKRLWKRLNMKKLHSQFMSEYGTLQNKLKDERDLKTVEKMLMMWKNFLSEISGKPMNTYTAKEIYMIYQNDHLLESLNRIDKSIYSLQFDDELFNDLTFMSSMANEEFIKNKSVSR